MHTRKICFENFTGFGYSRASFILSSFLKNVPLSVTTFLTSIQWTSVVKHKNKEFFTAILIPPKSVSKRMDLDAFFHSAFLMETSFLSHI